MGHRNSPEERGGQSAVCGAERGFAAAAAERGEVKASEKPLQREENRLKSVPPGQSVQIALLALRFYKTYLSFLFAGNCRFDPTCSQYAYQAIERFGALRGIWLGLKRLLRCHPLSRKFGYDPVPETCREEGSRSAHVGSAVASGHPTEIAHEVQP